MMKPKTVFAGVLSYCFLVWSSLSFAMPMAASGATQSSAVREIGVTCDAWGNCWDRHWEHEAEHAWRHWEHDQRRAWRHWGHDMEHAYKHGWDGWDGRDWHGGRWGEW